MARTVDEDLGQLEKDIRQLKIEYEQYFGGGKARPPSEIEWRIETTLKRYSDRGGQMNYGQRFRYGNLTQMYTKFRDMFRKRTQRREEGGAERHFGAAAREIESQRAAKNQKSPLAVAIVCADPSGEPEKVDAIFNAFLDCRSKAGETIDGMSRAKFEQFLRRKVDELRREDQNGEVEFVADLAGGKARLRARIKT